MFYLFLFCFIFSTAVFGHQGGLVPLMKNTSTITLTSKNITLINLDHHRYASINFWAKKESFTFYINASDCINKTASTWFIIGGGEPIGFTETIDLKDAKIKVTVNLNKSEVYFIKGNYISMGNITTFPYHANGTEPRVKFFAVNAGNCKLIYEMPKEIVPLIAATRRHDNENKTATTEISLTKVTETWYDPSTLKQIGFAYLWILTCVLAFVIGLCAGQRASRPHRLQRVRTISNSV